MRPVVVDPTLSFVTLVGDLERAPTDDDRNFVRDQIIVKLRQQIKHIDAKRREALEAVLGPLADLPDRLKTAPASETIALFRQHPSLATILDTVKPAGRREGVYISEHEDELISVEDDYGGKARPSDYIESFEAFVRANMNADAGADCSDPAATRTHPQGAEGSRHPARCAGFLGSKPPPSLWPRAQRRHRRAHHWLRAPGRDWRSAGPLRSARRKWRAAHHRQPRLDGQAEAVARRIGRALKAQPVGDPKSWRIRCLPRPAASRPLTASSIIGLGEVLKDLNTAIWDSHAA